jgi:hypothetical protein
MTLESVTFTCSQCGVQSTVSWEAFAQTFWSEVQSCECCGTSVTVRGDLTCTGCSQSTEVTVHGG